MEIMKFVADTERSGVRIDRYLADVCPDFSRSYLQKLLKEQMVSVNGKAVRANYKTQTGDEIMLQVPDMQTPDIQPEDIALDILYEDEWLLVVNKPKDMVVHPSAGHMEGTLVNAVMAHCGEHLSGINGVLRPGIVHRIDKDTTGALLICKEDGAHRDLAEQLKEHSIKRRYRAVVQGNLKEDEGTVDAPVGRHPIDRKKMAINHKNGKEAVTHYKVLERFGNATYIECRLETGRTHQIRVHMAHITHPLVGDPVYGGRPRPPKGASEAFISTLRKFDRQALHATMLRLYHPISGIEMEWHAPIPQDMVELIEVMRADFEEHKDEVDWL